MNIQPDYTRWHTEATLLILDRVADADRDWFESHPQHERYVRPYVPGEFGVGNISDLNATLVSNIAPGFRIRQSLTILIGDRGIPETILVVLADGTVYYDVPLVGWRKPRRARERRCRKPR